MLAALPNPVVVATLTPSNAITVTRIQAQTLVAPVGCKTNLALQLSNGTAAGAESLSVSAADALHRRHGQHASLDPRRPPNDEDTDQPRPQEHGLPDFRMAGLTDPPPHRSRCQFRCPGNRSCAALLRRCGLVHPLSEPSQRKQRPSAKALDAFLFSSRLAALAIGPVKRP